MWSAVACSFSCLFSLCLKTIARFLLVAILWGFFSGQIHLGLFGRVCSLLLRKIFFVLATYLFCVVELTCFMIWIASCACLTSAGVLASVKALYGSSARAMMKPRSVEVDC